LTYYSRVGYIGYIIDIVSLGKICTFSVAAGQLIR
jgi:hypothetical protein